MYRSNLSFLPGTGGAPFPLKLLYDALEGLPDGPARLAALHVELDLFPLRAVEQYVLDELGQVLEGRLHMDPVALDEGFEERQEYGGRLVAPGHDRPFTQGQLFIGDDQVRVEIFLHAQAEAGGTGAVGVVEGEHGRGDLRVADAAVRAGEFFAEDQRFGGSLHLDDAPRLFEGKLDAFRKAPLDALPEGNPVDDNVYIVLFVLVEDDVLREVGHLAVELNPRETLFSQVVDLLAVLPFSSPYDRGEDGNLRAVPEGEYGIDDLRGMLALDLLAAAVAIDAAQAGEKEPQVVIDLRDRADRRSGVLADALCSMLMAGERPSM